MPAAANTNSENTTVPSRIVPSKAEGIAFCSAYILQFVFIVVGNLLTIVLFAVNRRLRKRSLFLVINMAFADLMIGTVTLPIYIYSVGAGYKFWAGGWLNSKSLSVFYMVVDSFFTFASLISAAFISAERLYATYRPLKHRTLSMQAYRIILFMVWTLALLSTAIYIVLNLLIATKHSNVWTPLVFILTLIICGCNIGIWRKFQRGGLAPQRHSSASRNKRLSKTLMFVSTLAVLLWLPLTITNYLIFVHHFQIPSKYYLSMVVLTYSNSFVNPVVYAFRIPEFGEALALCCLRRPAAPAIINTKRRNKKASTLTSATTLRTSQTALSHLQQAFDQEVMVTKL